MISGRKGGGGGCRIFNYLPFLPPPHFYMERPLYAIISYCGCSVLHMPTYTISEISKKGSRVSVLN